MEAHGIEQLARLIFYIGAAGLSASFAALYKANSYITSGTFDPSHQASYWIRFSLGIIAGLLLAVLISKEICSKIRFLKTLLGLYWLFQAVFPLIFCALF